MPDRIKHLPQELANQIAAGEVVERPASILKELIENSIDAGGAHIVAGVERGGTKLIAVADDGTGMSDRDAITAFDRHATSKLSSKDDLFNIHTLGFRGEALASIAAVAMVRLKTRERDAAVGTCVEIEGGRLVKSTETGCPVGTEIEVRDLFYNMPARKSFLKSYTTELGHMLNTVTHYALAYEHIHFALNNLDRGNKTLLDFPPVRDIEERVFQIYGGDVLKDLIPFSCSAEGCSLHGLVSKPSLTFRSKENQLFFVNKRSVRNPALSHAVHEAYLDLTPGDRHPMVILLIDIDPASVDVNVHPAKREVKFKGNKYIHDMVVEAIRDGLQAKGLQAKGPTCVPVHRAFTDPVRYDMQEAPINPFTDRIEFQVQEIPIEPSVRALGQIGVLFIIAEIDGELNIVDQHAAHERIIYDRLKKGYKEGRVEVQGLLIPEIMELSHDKAQILIQYKDSLNRLGFDIDGTGDRSFMIRAIPAIFTGEDLKALLSDMIDEIMEMEPSPDSALKFIAVEDIMKALLSRKACHKAVRAKGLLSNGEMSSLLAALLKTDMPYTCPHGRPVARRFPSVELARMFDRK